MSLGVMGSSAGANASGWKEIARYDTAGSYTWTCPKTAIYGVFIVGGGGSGAAGKATSSSTNQIACGGAGGYVKSVNGQITNGTSFAVTVGAGGASVSKTSAGVQAGIAGGSSSFGTVSAGGGEGGKSGNTSISLGGQNSSYNTSRYGPYLAPSTYASSSSVYMAHLFLVNPYTGLYCVGNGGGAVTQSSESSDSQYSGGKNALTGLGGGDGVKSRAAAVVGESASEFGSGGGAAVGFNYNATSGAGADGIVIIYEKEE